MTRPNACRALAAVGSLVGGAAVFFTPIPLLDLGVMAFFQLLIASAVTGLMLRRPPAIGRLLPMVAAWAVVGGALGFIIELAVPIFGKLLLAPAFSLVWCYLMGEISLWRAALSK